MWIMTWALLRLAKRDDRYDGKTLTKIYYN